MARRLIALIKSLARLLRRLFRRLRIISFIRGILAGVLSIGGDAGQRERERRARRLEKMILSDLARQGYVFRQARKKKRIRVHRVKFRIVVVTQEECYFLLDTGKLPHRVTTAQITDEDVLRSLSDHCQQPIKTAYVHGELAYVARLSGKDFPRSFSYNAFKMASNAPALALPLGLAADKTHGYVDLVDLIHLLIVGPTGKGKSTFIHSFLCTIIDRNTPDDVVLWLADLKKSEFVIYEPLRAKRGRPGIVQRLEYEEAEVVNLLADAVAEMKRRQGMFQKFQAADINDYGRITNNYMPRVVVVIDEIMQLMTSSNKVEGSQTVKQWSESLLVLLASQGRSAGIHVVIATQVVSSKVLTTRITANYENVVCFGVKDWRQSQLAIGDSRAEGLPIGRVILKALQEYQEYQSCFLPAQARRLSVSRVANHGPGVGLLDQSEARRFQREAILLVQAACEQFDGAFPVARIYQSDGISGVIPKARVEEIAQRLERDGVLVKPQRRNAPRRVARGFVGRWELLETLYGNSSNSDSAVLFPGDSDDGSGNERETNGKQNPSGLLPGDPDGQETDSLISCDLAESPDHDDMGIEVPGLSELLDEVQAKLDEVEKLKRKIREDNN